MEKSQLQQTLRGRCLAIAENWYEAIAGTDFGPAGKNEPPRRFVELTEQVITLLFVEPFDPDRARAVGAALAEPRYIRPDTLSRTQTVLPRQITQGWSADQVASFSPRLAALLGEVAAGFFQRARKVILHEQDLVRRTLIAEIEQAEAKLGESSAHLEERIQERTADLVSAIEYLEQEVTERRRVEKALRERERFLSDVFSSIQDGISILDREFNVIRVNPTMRRWYAHAVPLVGKICYRAYHGRSEPCESCPSRHTFETGEADHGTIARRGPDGEINGWLDVYSFPLLDTATGQIRGVIQYVRDITERKQAEEALRQVEEHMRTFVESLDDVVYFQGLDGSISMLNAAGARITGYSVQEFQERPQLWREIVHPEDRSSIEEFLSSRSSTHSEERASSFEIEYRLQTKSGEWRWMHSRMVSARDAAGRCVGYNCIDRDITQIKRAEEILRQRNRELALLDRAGQALTSTLDLDQVFIAVLEEVRHLLDVAACSVWLIESETGELVCRQATGPQSDAVRGWRLAPEEGIAGWVAHTGKSLIVPDTRFDERHFKRVDELTGMELRSILSVPLRVKQGVIGVIQVLDTEVGRFEFKDQRLLDSLAASAAIAIDNARLVKALRQRTEELEARNEELDAFAHTVAHDLKNPLGLIVGFSEVLREEFTALKGEELCRYLNRIARSGRKMNSIIDELLLLAGVRRLEVETGPLDMAQVVAEARRQLAHVIEEQEAEITTPDTWPVTLGYAPWVEEVWVNYLSNALKYGGRPPRVKLGATVQPDGMVRFWVRDNGPGLTPEEQSRLFTPFTRLDQANTKGHGLGLSIVRRIVEKLGGQVGVESEVGKGSIFSFTLPAADG